MIDELEKKLQTFQFISTKSEVTFNLILFQLVQKDFDKAEESIGKYVDLVYEEPFLLARSELIHKSVLSLLKVINFNNNVKIREFTDLLLPKIELPFHKLDAQLEILKVLSKFEEKKVLVEEIKRIDEEIQKQIEFNIIILVLDIFNPSRDGFNSNNFVSQNSLDTLNKKFLTCLSEIANRRNEEELFKFALKRLNLIKLKLYYEEAFRDIINNYYIFAMNKRDKALILKINEISKRIRDKTYWIETLYNYTTCLITFESFQEIRDIIDSLISSVPNVKGEFSRTVFLKETIRMIQNLDDESIKLQYLTKIKELNNNLQGLFSSILVKIRLLETLYQLDRFDEAISMFKEVISKSKLISNHNLFFKINERLIDLIPRLKNIINDDLISYFISELNKIKEIPLRSKILLILAEKIMNLNTQLKKIKQILEKNNKPYISNNQVFVNHMYPILNFFIKQAFQTNDKAIIENPSVLIEKANSPTEKSFLILELISQFRKKGQSELANKYQRMIMKQVDKITNEFERKKVLIKLIRALF